MNWRLLKPRGPLKEVAQIFWPQILTAYLGWGEIPTSIYALLGCLWFITFAQLYWRPFRFNQKYFNFVSLLVPAFVFLQYKTFLGRDAASTFLLVLAALKAFEYSPQKDRYFSVYLNIATLAVGLLFDFGFFPSLIVTIGLLSCLFQILSPALRSKPFARRWAYVGVSAVLAVPLSVFLFFFFPRFGFNFGVGIQGQSNRAWTGFSDEIKPGSLGQLIQSDEIIFRAHVNSFMADNELYWRAVVLEIPSGLAWGRLTGQSVTRNLDAIYDPDYTINLEPQPHAWLFTLDGTENLGFTPAISASISEGTYRRTTVRQELITYAGKLAENDLMSTPEKTAFNLKPETQFLKTRINNFIQNLPPLKSTREKIRYLENFIREGNFEYSLSSESLVTTELGDFLFNTKVGYCEHYASAFTHLLRYWGVSARVVAGFLGGEKNLLGDYITVRGRHAHAWLEYVDDSSRWRRWDPTQYVGNGTSSFANLNSKSTGIFATIFNQVVGIGDYINYEWTRFFLGFDRKEQMKQMSELKYPPIYYLGFVVLVTLASLGIVLLVLRRRFVSTAKNIYTRFLEKIKKRKILDPTGMTPAEVRRNLAKLYPDLRPSIDKTFHHYNRIYQENLYIDLIHLDKQFKELTDDLKRRDKETEV